MFNSHTNPSCSFYRDLCLPHLRRGADDRTEERDRALDVDVVAGEVAGPDSVRGADPESSSPSSSGSFFPPVILVTGVVCASDEQSSRCS